MNFMKRERCMKILRNKFRQSLRCARPVTAHPSPVLEDKPVRNLQRLYELGRLSSANAQNFSASRTAVYGCHKAVIKLSLTQ